MAAPGPPPALYDRIGDGYDATRRADPTIVEALGRLLALPPGGRCLDLGTGTGNYAVALHHAGLEVVGVDPSAHGKGLGKALILPMLERADQERMPCYLITHNASNQSFYRRFGFETICERAVCDNGPVAFSMRRPVCSTP